MLITDISDCLYSYDFKSFFIFYSTVLKYYAMDKPFAERVTSMNLSI